MQSRVKFSKYEGLGNDIIIFDFPPEKLGLGPVELRDFLRRVAHRNYGVGADEIAFLRPLKGGTDTAWVAFFNSDGSRAEMCGNGMRCVAKHLFESGKTGKRKIFFIRTDAGPKECQVETARTGLVGRVSVDMGSASPEKIKIKLAGKVHYPMRVSMGNPHAVFFGKYGVDRMCAVAKSLQRHRLFPQGVNVEFARPRNKRRMDLIVWERGCGFTLACGSGACAAAAAAAHKGLCAHDAPIDVYLPGGVLKVTVSRRNQGIVMSGPVRRVFSGVLS